MIRLNSGSCYLLAAYKYTDVLLDSLQGAIVAVTFCYRNGEVPASQQNYFSPFSNNYFCFKLLTLCHLNAFLHSPFIVSIFLCNFNQILTTRTT